jgi:hypothetical protein
MDSFKLWRAARRLYRAEIRITQLRESADSARNSLLVALGQTDNSELVAGGYRVSLASDGAVEITLLPMLRGDQLDLPLIWLTRRSRRPSRSALMPRPIPPRALVSR